MTFLPQFALLIALPFGMAPPVFWMYACAVVLLILGVVKIAGELPEERGLSRLVPFARFFFAISLGVFGTEHFTLTAGVAKLVPRWMPGHIFWVYFVGAAFICAAVSIIVRVQARLAAALVAMTFFLFVLMMDLPAASANPGNRFFWALALRQLAFSGGALALALAPRSASLGLFTELSRRWSAVPRFFVGIPALFYGVQHFLHPTFVPAIPLPKVAPDWIHGRVPLSYFVGTVLVVAGVCLLIGRGARIAACVLGLTVLLAVCWVYLPMAIAAPTDLVALNFFFDTLMFGGAVLLLANTGTSERRV